MTDTSAHPGGPARTSRGLVLLVVAALTLAACGDSTKRALGLQRTAPDEFAVAPRAPLSQPPDFRLRPPRPGAEDLTTVSSREQARQAVFRGDDARAPGTNSGPAAQPAPRTDVARSTTGEAAFLSRAGALETDPLVRSQIDRESSILADENQNFIRKLLGLEQDSIDEEIDAAAEARRLRENQALGVPAADGKTPTISRTRKGLFDIL
ncbi:MAG: DUF3035 domain-containing protein [Rhodospirillaceae bacterium]|nr:DUF3035 domain-containing protein [Rhodospirillaceae bacterium]MBT3929782.1 DUF3035 domain-containing protein [Rhodospirillaceae bacterium]MBT4772869.1 DUF3035 domain-containing protein [Rhodospirillaceae bacterium]MBT5358234.1 DUF3035 domain-containing protein [Rhodospirillaceae bacterium]MBT5767993.1 DUF3035 domain-containing protein [Rhodospirillaceae bacterium]